MRALAAVGVLARSPRSRIHTRTDTHTHIRTHPGARGILWVRAVDAGGEVGTIMARQNWRLSVKLGGLQEVAGDGWVQWMWAVKKGR